jgi:DNA-binding HxlR family transcriptional regulator
MLAGALRFGEIQEAIPDLSNRMLSERLREFEVEESGERPAAASSSTSSCS